MKSDSPHSPAPVIPARAGTIGMILFLASLGMLFFASLLAYVFIRFTSKSSPALGAIAPPSGLWLSTIILLSGSVTMHLAVDAVRRERLLALQRRLLATLFIALAFIAAQSVFLAELLQQHFAARTNNIQLYGLIFFLVLLHAAHVFGGVIALVLVYIGARRGRYDHEHYAPVRHAAFYWHFLDAVWLTMFTLFVVVR